jgi:hypothetical protein
VEHSEQPTCTTWCMRCLMQRPYGPSSVVSAPRRIPRF